jgi:ubiquitin-like modifier-activating enzyme ATG7
VLKCYEEDPWAFVERALNEKGWVEEMSGLKEVQRKADKAAAEMELEDEEDEGGLEDEGELL